MIEAVDRPTLVRKEIDRLHHTVILQPAHHHHGTDAIDPLLLIGITLAHLHHYCLIRHRSMMVHCLPLYAITVYLLHLVVFIFVLHHQLLPLTLCYLPLLRLDVITVDFLPHHVDVTTVDLLLLLRHVVVVIAGLHLRRRVAMIDTPHPQGTVVVLQYQITENGALRLIIRNVIAQHLQRESVIQLPLQLQ